MWSRPSLDAAFVAVCDAVLMALEGEGRSPLPRSLSDSASARLTQNLARSQRGREGLAVSCPIEFRANLRRRAKPGVDLLSAIRIRLLNRAGPTKAPCIMATSSPDEWSVGCQKSEAYSKLSRSKYPSPSSIWALCLLPPETAKIPLSSPPRACCFVSIYR